MGSLENRIHLKMTCKKQRMSQIDDIFEGKK